MHNSFIRWTYRLGIRILINQDSIYQVLWLDKSVIILLNRIIKLINFQKY